MLFKVFIILFLIVLAFKLGRAFVTGSVQLRRQDNPQKFKQTMGIFTVIFVLLVAMQIGRAHV